MVKDRLSGGQKLRRAVRQRLERHFPGLVQDAVRLIDKGRETVCRDAHILDRLGELRGDTFALKLGDDVVERIGDLAKVAYHARDLIRQSLRRLVAGEAADIVQDGLNLGHRGDQLIRDRLRRRILDIGPDRGEQRPRIARQFGQRHLVRAGDQGIDLLHDAGQAIGGGADVFDRGGERLRDALTLQLRDDVVERVGDLSEVTDDARHLSGQALHVLALRDAAHGLEDAAKLFGGLLQRLAADQRRGVVEEPDRRLHDLLDGKIADALQDALRRVGDVCHVRRCRRDLRIGIGVAQERGLFGVVDFDQHDLQPARQERGVGQPRAHAFGDPRFEVGEKLFLFGAFAKPDPSRIDPHGGQKVHIVVAEPLGIDEAGDRGDFAHAQAPEFDRRARREPREVLIEDHAHRHALPVAFNEEVVSRGVFVAK